MPKKEAFVIPQSLNFEHTSKGVTIENQGDIVIKGSIGMNIHKLVSTDGNIHIEQPLSVEEIVALNGSVSSSTSLEVTTIQAKVLESAHSLTVRKRIHVSKQLLVHGDLTAPTVQSLGNLEVHGSIECEELNVEGNANIKHNIHAQSIHSHDSLEVGGHVSSEDFVHSGAELTLGSIETTSLQAPSALVTVNNALQVNRIQCNELIASGTINVPTLQVTGAIQLSDAAIQSDVVLCQHFTSNGEVTGKILVLEAPKQEGTHRIKGCLELSDFTEFVPDIEHFLTSRGLEKQNGELVLTIPEEEKEDEESSSESATDLSSESSSALHVNLNAIPSPSESGISEESSMFHEDVTTMGEDQEEIARPARIAVPIIDQSVGTNEDDTTVSDTTDIPPDVSAQEIAEDEINLEQETTEVKSKLDDGSYFLPSTNPDDIAMVTSEIIDDMYGSDLMEADGDLDTPVATEMTLSEDWTYDEGEHSQGEGTVLDEPQVPESNPKHEAIRTDILALINNYDHTKYPDAIRELLNYLETEDYLTLRDELRHLWSELLKHHQHEGSRIPHMATGAFTNLSKSLQDL